MKETLWKHTCFMDNCSCENQYVSPHYAENMKHYINLYFPALIVSKSNKYDVNPPPPPHLINIKKYMRIGGRLSKQHNQNSSLT